MMIPETIDAARNGDAGAFALIVERYRQSVFRICVRILGDSDEAEDAVQETFVRAWQSLQGYDPRYSIATWLRTIACRLCYDVLRRRTRQRQYEQDACRQGSGDGIGDPESLRNLLRFLQKYDLGERDSIVLYPLCRRCARKVRVIGQGCALAEHREK